MGNKSPFRCHLGAGPGLSTTTTTTTTTTTRKAWPKGWVLDGTHRPGVMPLLASGQQLCPLFHADVCFENTCWMPTVHGHCAGLWAATGNQTHGSQHMFRGSCDGHGRKRAHGQCQAQVRQE